MNQPQVFRPRYLLPELNQVTGPLIIDLTNNRQTSKAQSVDRVQQLMKSNENVDQLVQLWQKQKQQTPSSYANDSFIIKEQPTCENSPQIIYNKSNSALFDSNSARKIQHKKTISICLNDLTSIMNINQEESDTFSQSKTRSCLIDETICEETIKRNQRSITINGLIIKYKEIFLTCLCQIRRRQKALIN
ncbi:hypothetical protein pb186bvf_005513 [Paramecium bursaria]